ncbi:MAG TPA: cell division protein FtsQ [Thermoanaerobaculia bacterium]|nr:cell division protein FtsQ [Thermoanaerobaculia bacterium]
MTSGLETPVSAGKRAIPAAGAEQSAVHPSRTALLIPGLAMLACLLWGAYQASVALMRPAEEPAIPRGRQALLDGRMTRTFEKRFNSSLPARAQLIAAANSIRYMVTRGAPDGVRVGRDGWLFLSEELEYHQSSGSNLRRRVELAARVNDALRARNIALVVAVVPDKARVYERYLPGGRQPVSAASRYDDFVRAAWAKGLTVPDLATALKEASRKQDVYYRTDTHWNQAGARVVATELASAVAALNLGLPQSSFRTVPRGGEESGPNDLLRLMGLSDVTDSFRPRGDREIPVETVKSDAATDAGADDLFGDSGTPVALVGSSYSQRANFHGSLQEALRADVLNAAQDDAQFMKALQRYLSNAAFKEAPPQLIVWELPERYLTAPLLDEGAWIDGVLQ